MGEYVAILIVVIMYGVVVNIPIGKPKYLSEEEVKELGK